MLVYFLARCNILRHFGIFYDKLVILWYFGISFPVLVSCNKKKSGNPVCEARENLENALMDF
jgi:hypothetical protein